MNTEHVQSTLQLIFIWAIPIIYAITLHEVAHGYVASKLGDKTALWLGRLSLNPLKHIDLVGTILVPILFLSLGGFIFGWAKPVPVEYRNLKHPQRDMALVALAGPVTNFLMALAWAAIAKIVLLFSDPSSQFLKIMIQMGLAGISINLMLMVLNLIPIPPLDGSRVLASILPARAAYRYESIASFGFVILIALILTGALTYLILPPFAFLENFIFQIFDLKNSFFKLQ